MSRPRPPLVSALLALVLGLGACGDGATEGGSTAAPVDQAAFEQARNAAFRLFDQSPAHPKTIEALLAAYALDPDAYGVNVRLGQAYAEQKLHAEALPYFERAYAERPDDSATLLQIVTLLVRLDRAEEALVRVDGLLGDEKTRGAGLYQKAYILDTLGRRDEALAALEQADGLPFDDAYRALSLHGRFLQEDGRFAEAESLFERALAGRPDYKETLKGLADCNRRLGHEEEARHWDEVLGLVLDLTDNEYIRKQRDVRKEKLERLAQIHPMWGEGQLELADLHRRDGETVAACAAFERWLTTHASERDADELAALRARYCGDSP
ncbi:MAG: tetratricopeptide repeat protein [Planctomycetes bacterium]|nr:tetratricopeptide repeat protein [Planctomycetota bacterium]